MGWQDLLLDTEVPPPSSFSSS